MAVVPIIVTMFAMKYTFNYMDRAQVAQAPATTFQRPRELPPSPRLQASPRQELKDYCDAQERELNGYGWVDQRLKSGAYPGRQGDGPDFEEPFAGARESACRGDAGSSASAAGCRR